MFTLQQRPAQTDTVPILSLGPSPEPCLSVASLAVPHPKPASSKLCHRSVHWQITTGRSSSRHGNIMPTRKYPTSKYKPRSSLQKTLELARKTPTSPRHHLPETDRRGTIGQEPWRGVVTTPVSWFSHPHLPAGVDETDTANVVHLSKPLTMHARHQILNLARPRTLGRSVQPTISVRSCMGGVSCCLALFFLPQHHEFGPGHRGVVLDWRVGR